MSRPAKRYDRRPRRDWDNGRRRGATGQIGTIRLVGFVAVLFGSFAVLGRFGSDAPAHPRIATDAALAPPITATLPDAVVTSGTPATLITRLSGGLVADLAVLPRPQIERLVTDGTCEPTITEIAYRGDTAYFACEINADGSSDDLADEAITALQSLAGRDALLAAGLDVRQAGDGRPTTPQP